MKTYFVTLSMNDIRHNDTQYTCIDSCYADCRDYSNVMLNVFMLSIIIQSVVGPHEGLLA
jgi:hypothetical protein